MIGIHIVAVLLTFKDRRPQVMVIVMILNAIFILALFNKFGYTRIFGSFGRLYWPIFGGLGIIILSVFGLAVS